MADSMTVTLPMPPNMANNRVHWRTKHKERRSYLGTCDDLSAAGMIPNPPKMPVPFAEISTEMVLWAGMDDDNAMARHKWALDWLVTRGYLAGDSRKHLRWASFPRQSVSRKAPAAIRFTITPIPQP